MNTGWHNPAPLGSALEFTQPIPESSIFPSSYITPGSLATRKISTYVSMNNACRATFHAPVTEMTPFKLIYSPLSNFAVI